MFEETFVERVTVGVVEASRTADRYVFGKPVWDFEYPESSIFVTENGLIGSYISVVSPGDIFFVPLGCMYPLVLRPEEDCFLVRAILTLMVLCTESGRLLQHKLSIFANVCV